MTSWFQERRLELVCHKTIDDIHKRMRKVSKGDRKALRREFQGWFSKDFDDIEVFWLEHFQHWEDQ